MTDIPGETTSLVDSEILTQKQAEKRIMLDQIAAKHHLNPDVVQGAIDHFIDNIDIYEQMPNQINFDYDLPPHRVPKETKEVLKQIGAELLKDSPKASDPDTQADVGRDLFETFAVEPGTDEYTEWQSYLTQETQNQSK